MGWSVEKERKRIQEGKMPLVACRVLMHRCAHAGRKRGNEFKRRQTRSGGKQRHKFSKVLYTIFYLYLYILGC